jgi:poly-beta-1,6-N-acetyl-D-glucosamine biosynthesis protein PgaD
MKSPLIERSDLQSTRLRALYGTLTLAFWAFWVYLWLPLLALLAWGLGIEQAYQYMVAYGGYRDVIRLLGFYALVIGLLSGSLTLWALYNIVRFRGVENRVEARAITPTQCAAHFALDPQSILDWQGAQRLYVTHDAAGRVVQVAVLAAGVAVPA